MTPERYERVTDLFDQARLFAPPLRSDFLRQACGEDELLCEAVEQLLRAADDHPDFLCRPVLTREIRAEATARLLQVDSELIAAVGPWRLTELLGEGGFARVYLGEQERPVRRRVAIKILREGALTEQGIVRLHAECQALAVLRHSSIVGVLDAGRLMDGSSRPFLVMEYVDGEPITSYCRRVELGLRERVGLIATLCDAIQHAHIRGVLHRDLKPSNVLVTVVDAAAAVKVIDFGVAKAIGDARLSETTIRTAEGALVGTLGYMSPEQLRGVADIRSDVYALGVLLYELCTGRLPIDVDSASVVEAAQRVERNTAPSASTINRECRGDLDVILETALAKDPERRYQSAGDLAADLRRYLGREAILARRPSMIYLARTYARRYRAVVAMAAMVFLVGLVGFAFVLAESDRARRAEDRWAERVRDSLQREFAALEARSGTLAEREKISRTGHDDAQELLARRPDASEYLDLAAEAARQCSKIALERDERAKALQLGKKALEWRKAAYARDRANAAIREALVLDLVQLGDVNFALGELNAMAERFSESSRLMEEIAAERPSDENQAQLAWSYQRLAAAALQAGHVSEALREARRSLEITDRLLAAKADNPSALGCARQTQMYLAALAKWNGDEKGVARHRSAALDIAEQLYELEPENREHVFGLLHGWMAEADSLSERSHARPYYERGHKLATAQLQADPHHAKFATYAAGYALRLAYCARDDEDEASAVALARNAFAYMERTSAESAADLWGAASLYSETRGLFKTLGLESDEVQCANRVRALCNQLIEYPDASAEYHRGCAEMLLALEDSSDTESALRLATRALEHAEKENAALLLTLASAYQATGDSEQALALLDQALTLSTDEKTERTILNRITALKFCTVTPCPD